MELFSALSKCLILSRAGHIAKVVNVHVFFHTDMGLVWSIWKPREREL